MTPTRVALVGCGFIGVVHSFALKAVIRGGLVDARVVAACDRDRSRAEAVAGAHEGARATADVTEAIEAADAVWICTPTATHLELVEAAASQGVAIYCEKPLATDLPGAERLAAAAAGVPNQVGLVLRSAAPFATLAALLTPSGVTGARSDPAVAPLGRPMAAILRDDQFFPIQGMYGSTWRSDVAVAGGGTLIEHSIHDLDVLAWLLGPAVRVTARTANYAGHPGVEDVAAVTLTHASGATSTLTSVWHGLLSRPSTRRLEVFCQEGLAVLDNEDAGPVRVEHPEGVSELGLPPEVLAFAARLGVDEALRLPLLAYARADHAFLTALQKGTAPAPDLGVGLAAHRVADAAYRSAARDGEPVDLTG